MDRRNFLKIMLAVPVAAVVPTIMAKTHTPKAGGLATNELLDKALSFSLDPTKTLLEVVGKKKGVTHILYRSKLQTWEVSSARIRTIPLNIELNALESFDSVRIFVVDEDHIPLIEQVVGPMDVGDVLQIPDVSLTLS